MDGKKYHSNYKSYVTEIRAVSDELCRKYKLSVIDTETSHHVAKPYAEWLAEKNGQPTWRTAIRQDVDEAIQQSLTWRQFLTVLERKGYEVRMGRKYPVLRPPGKERFVRFKTLGKRYTPEAIQTRILYPQSYRPYVENPPTIQHGRLRSEQQAPPQADRAAGAVLSLSVRIGCAPSQAAPPQLCRAAGCLQVRPAHPADGVSI